jgi:hypothetical protein
VVPNLSIKPRVPLSCLPQRTFLAWKISFVPIKSIAPNNHIENVAVPGLNPLLANLKQAVTDRLTTTGNNGHFAVATSLSPALANIKQWCNEYGMCLFPLSNPTQ